MDFLIQHFDSTVNLKPVNEVVQADNDSLEKTSERRRERQASLYSEAGSEYSTSTNMTGSTDRMIHETQNAFAKLRTAVDSSYDIESGEHLVDRPNRKEGDWGAYGRVSAHVIVWPTHVTVKERKRILKDRCEWVVEGSLWSTKRQEIVFLIDTSVPPEHTHCSLAVKKSKSGFSISSFRRHPSNTVPESINRPVLLRRRTSSSSTCSSGRTVSPPPESQTTSPQAADQSPESGKGVKAFVKNLFSASRSSSSTRSSNRELKISRTKTSERELNLSRTKSRSSIKSSGKEFRKEHPQQNAPFPLYKGHEITALYIPSLHSIHSIRSYAHQETEKPFSDLSPPSSSKATPLELSSDHSSPVNYQTGIASDVFSVSFSKSAIESGNSLCCPCIELDIVPESLANGRSMGANGVDTGKNREATIGFVFHEPLLSKEAEDFKQLLHSAVSESTE